MKNKCVIILAAGKGTRMKNKKPKVLCEVLFEPMLGLVLFACNSFEKQNKCVVISPEADLIKNYIQDKATLAIQPTPQGTAHAVLSAKNFLENKLEYNVFICYGDSPLIDSDTIENALNLHEKNNASATLITTELENCYGYGRIIRDINGNLIKIIEEKDASETEKNIKEVNSGAYWFKVKDLLEVLNKIKNNNANNEFYLTDAIEILIKNNKPVNIFKTKNKEFCLGVNDNKQLFEINQILRQKVIDKLTEQGVEFISHDGIIISPYAIINANTTILPGTIIKKNTVIGQNCIIGPNTLIENSIIGNDCIVNSSQIYNSKIEDSVKIGPFCHIRPNSQIAHHSKIGNFVEIKNSNLGAGTAVSHLTYVGDSDVGKNVNFGCGVVTTNFDGVKKYRCEIQDGAFLGCNTNLIAPVKIGKNAYTGAGSTIYKDVEDYALGIARSKQTNIDNFSKTKLAGRKLKVD